MLVNNTAINIRTNVSKWLTTVSFGGGIADFIHIYLGDYQFCGRNVLCKLHFSTFLYSYHLTRSFGRTKRKKNQLDSCLKVRYCCICCICFKSYMQVEPSVFGE